MNLFEAALPWDDNVPPHIKRARDARRYADITMPKVGDLVNLEFDLLAKYVERISSRGQ